MMSLEEAEEFLMHTFVFLLLAGLVMLLIVMLEPRPYLEQYISMDYLAMASALVLMAYLAVRYVRASRLGKGR